MNVPTLEEIAEFTFKLFGNQDVELCRIIQRQIYNELVFGFETNRRYHPYIPSTAANRHTTDRWGNFVEAIPRYPLYLEPWGYPLTVNHPPIIPHLGPQLPHNANVEQVAPAIHTLAPGHDYKSMGMTPMRRGARVRTGKAPSQTRTNATTPSPSRLAPGPKPVPAAMDPLRKFVCEEPGCGAGFRKKPGLTRHNRSHTGERPYHCEVCHGGFTRSDARNKHQKICQGP